MAFTESAFRGAPTMKTSLPVLAFLAVALIGSAGSAIVWAVGERAHGLRGDRWVMSRMMV
jgi:hypothetical protein